MLVNNLSECFYAYILDELDKPIIIMMKIIQRKLMRRYQLKRDEMKKMDGKLVPTIMKKVERNGLESLDFILTYAGNRLLEVEHKQK